MFNSAFAELDFCVQVCVALPLHYAFFALVYIRPKQAAFVHHLQTSSSICHSRA